MKEYKTYLEISRSNKSTDRRHIRLFMILATICMIVYLLGSIHFEFAIGADGSKRLTIEMSREQSSALVKPDVELSNYNADGSTRLIEEARRCIDTGEYRKAIDLCTEALRLNPDNMEAYAVRGRAYDYTEEYERAIDDLDKAIAAGANLAVSYHARGLAYLETEDYTRALNDFDASINVDPNFYKPYANRAYVHIKLRQIDSVIDDCNKVIELEPELSMGYQNRAVAHIKQGNIYQAMGDLATAAKIALTK